MNEKAFQEYYPDHLSHCYGCGRLNRHGLHIRSYWEGDDSIAVFTPQPYHTAIPGFVYGGLIASLMDCHSTGTASAAAYRLEGRDMGTEPYLRFVTASLHVEYLRPTPLGVPLTLKGRIKEQSARKAVVSVTLYANDELCSRGEVVAVRMPQAMNPLTDAGG